MIQTLGPPYPAILAIAYEKLGIAFSNTIYLKIIWRLSTAPIDYIRCSDQFCKISDVFFLTIFGPENERNYSGRNNSVIFMFSCIFRLNSEIRSIVGNTQVRKYQNKMLIVES